MIMKELVKREDTHNPTKKKKTRAIKSNNHESITYNVLLLTYYTLHSRRDERPPRGAKVYRMVRYKRVYRHKSTCSFVRSFNETIDIYIYIHTMHNIHTYAFIDVSYLPLAPTQSPYCWDSSSSIAFEFVELPICQFEFISCSNWGLYYCIVTSLFVPHPIYRFLW